MKVKLMRRVDDRFQWALLLTTLLAWQVSLSGTTVGAVSDLDLRVLESDHRDTLYNYLLQLSASQDEARSLELKKAVLSTETFQAYQRNRHQAYRDLLGPLPDRTPLEARVTGQVVGDGFRIEKVLYESVPQHRVTALLYLPTEGTPPFPAVLFACGHSDNGKAFPAYQIAAMLLARNGFVVLSYDPISQGERVQLPDAPRYGTTTHTLLNMGARLVGRSTVWYEAWDGIRGIDYLQSRPEVDRSRLIGMTGTSGGGTQTTFLMALDDRIGPAAPSCYIMQRTRKFASIGPADGCQHLPGEGAQGIDHIDYVLMRAPRPTVVLAATEDFFDIESTRQTCRDAVAGYAVLDAAERFEFLEADNQHGMHVEHRRAAVRWMRRWLTDRQEKIDEFEPSAYEDLAIQVTAAGQVGREFVDEVTVADLNLREAKRLVGARRRTWLGHSSVTQRALIMRLLGIRKELPALTWQATETLSESGMEIHKLVLQRADEPPTPALLMRPQGTASTRLPARIYVHPVGKQVEAGAGGRLQRDVAEGRIVLALDVRGWGETRDRGSKAKYHNHEHRTATVALHVGRPLLGQRVEDVLGAIEYLRARPDVDAQRIELEGVGRAGPVVLHAAVLDPGVASVHCSNWIESWISGVVAKPLQANVVDLVVPGVLQHYDLPDLVRLLGDRWQKRR